MSPALKQFGFTDILGWSFSRFNTFTACKREYYYQYYGKYDTEFPKQKIDALKGLTSIPLETGAIVHDLIRDTLQVVATGGKLLTLDELLHRFDKLKSKYFRKTFAEIYYGEQSQIPEAEITERVKAALDNFLNSPRLHWLLENAVPHHDKWIIEPPGYGETRINNLKAYCKVDFLFPVDGQIFIIDWKTGKKKEEHSSQLLGYASWASYHLEHDVSQITTIDAYLLPEYQEEEITFDKFDFVHFTQEVHAQTQQLYEYTESIEWNIPKPKSEFPLAESTRICRYCNFRELCNRHTQIRTDNGKDFGSRTMNKSFGKYAMINPVKHVFELETDWYWWIEPATANAELEIQKVFAQERFKVLEDGSKIQMYVTTLEVAITEIAVTFGGTNIPTSETDPSPILKKGASLEEIKEVLKEMPREMLLELWGAVGDAVPGLGPAKPRKPKTEEEGSDETKNS